MTIGLWRLAPSISAIIRRRQNRIRISNLCKMDDSNVTRIERATPMEGLRRTALDNPHAIPVRYQVKGICRIIVRRELVTTIRGTVCPLVPILN
jgi:hypothetical protein